MSAEKNPAIGIVILNWNGLEMTRQCIGSLRQQTYSDFVTVVVDNGSNDGSVAWLQQQDDVILIANDRNLGFAKAVNQGLRRTIDLHCTYVAAVNNDTELAPNWLAKLVHFMEANPETSFAQGATKQLNDKKRYDSSGIYLERGFIPRQRAEGLLDPQLDMPVVGPNAAGAIYRTSMLKNIRQHNGDFFDSRFFAYVEDVDFDLRCTTRGHIFSFVPEATMYHTGSATGNRIAKKKMFWGARNMIWLVYKNVPLPVLRRVFKSIVKSHLANLQFLWREQRANFWPYLRGITVGLLSLPRFYRDRRTNLRKQKIDTTAFLELLVPSNPPLSNPFKKIANLLK